MLDHTLHTDEDLAAAQDRAGRDRAALAASARALRDNLTFAAVAWEGARLAASAVRPATEAVGRAAMKRPLAVAVIAAGTAWLLRGRAEDTPAPPAEPLAGTKFEALSRWEDEGGPCADLPEPDKVLNADRSLWQWAADEAAAAMQDQPLLATLAAAAGGALIAALLDPGRDTDTPA
jgi:hypothetical protein